MNARIKTKMIKTTDIKPNPKNPKKHWVEKISESIQEMGYIEPIVIDENDVILAGHGRLKALLENGIKEVEVIVKKGLTAEQKERYMLLSNKIVEAGGWDYELLAEFDEAILTSSGFDQSDLDEIFGMEMEDNFDVQKELKKILKNGIRRVKDGDIWKLGEHKLLIGNCTKRENWERLFGSEKYDFLFVDPPYKIGMGVGNRKQKTKTGTKIRKFRTYDSIGLTNKDGKPLNDKSPVIKFGYKGNREYLGTTQAGGIPEYDQWLSIAKDFQNPMGANVMIFENWKNTRDLWDAIEKYWSVKNMIIWAVNNRCQGFSSKYKFFSKYDIAQLAGEGVLNQEYEEELDKYLQAKGQKLLDTYEIILYSNRGKSYWDKKKGSKWARINDHITWPAQTEASGGQNIIFGTKPLPVLTPFIKILSPRGGLVVDCFSGSGSTILASEIMKRRCYGIEISATYAEVILHRFERFTNKKAVKIGELK
jgi:DNA modification methylase